MKQPSLRLLRPQVPSWPQPLLDLWEWNGHFKNPAKENISSSSLICFFLGNPALCFSFGLLFWVWVLQLCIYQESAATPCRSDLKEIPLETQREMFINIKIGKQRVLGLFLMSLYWRKEVLKWVVFSGSFNHTNSGPSDICLKVVCAIIDPREHFWWPGNWPKKCQQRERWHVFYFFHENIFLLIGWVLHGCFPPPFLLLTECGQSGIFGQPYSLSVVRPSLDIGVTASSGCTHGHSYIFFLGSENNLL